MKRLLILALCVLQIPALEAQTKNATIVPVAYTIALNPDIVAGRFTGRETIDVDIAVPADSVVLNAAGLEFTTVSADDDKSLATVSVDAKAETAKLQFPHVLTPGRHKLVISYSGSIRRGLFSVDFSTEQGQKKMLVTQFEFSSARYAFPCWDEPSAKATFTLSATLPASQAAISNTPVAASSPAGNDAHGAPLQQVTFATTPRMSPYLLVLVTGEMEAVHGDAAGVKIGVWTTAGHAQEGMAALQRAQQLLPFYNAFFGVAYPLSKLDMIAVPHLGFDAMENWGGITFQDNELLYDPKSSSTATLQNMRHLVGHEIAHQWFGDLVTTATWDDVWLNESFAEWMSYKATQQLDPQEVPWLNFHSAKTKVMGIDTGPTKSIVGNSFDANTSYRKGPAILRMLETYLGEGAFRKGIRDYIRTHAYGNATTTDLWASLENASGKPLTAIAASFTTQPGVPLVRVESRCQLGQTVVTVTQRRFTIDYPDAEQLTWQIPVTVGQVGGTSSASQTVVLGRSPDTLHFAGCGRAAKANLGDTGYYYVEYDETTRSKLVAGYANLAASDRVSLLSDQWSLVKAGDAGISAYLDLTRRLSSEREFVVWADVLDVLRQIDAMERGASGQAAFRAYARALLQPVMKRVGWAPLASDKVETVLLRARLISALGQFGDRAVISEARRRFSALQENGVPLPVELRGAILETVGRNADGTTFDQLHALARAARSEEEKRDLYWAMASAQDPTLIDRTVEITKTNELSKDQLEWLLVIAAQRSDADRVWYDIEHARKDVLGGDLSEGLLSAVAEHSFDPKVAHQVPLDPAFASRKSVPEVVRQIEVQAKLRSRISAGVAQYLQHPGS